MEWTSCLYKKADGTVTDVATLNCIPIVFYNIIQVLVFFSGFVAVVFVIIAGFKLLFSGGDAKQVEEARKTLTYAIIGLIVVLISFAIVQFIANVTGVDCIREFGLNTCK